MRHACPTLLAAQSLAALFAFFSFPACDDAADAGSFSLAFVWPDGAAPDFEARPLFVRADIQRWPDGQPDKAVTLNSAGPTQIASDGSVRLAFEDLTYGDNRVAVVTMRNGPAATDQLFYYGVSGPFSIVAGEDLVVSVPLALDSAPGTSASGEIDSEIIRLVLDEQPVGARVNRRIVAIDVKLAPDSLSQITLANNATLSRAKLDLDPSAIATLKKSPLDADYYRVVETWSLDEDLDENLQGQDGDREVYVRLTNRLGIEGPAIKRSVFVDTTPPIATITPFDEVAAISYRKDQIVEFRLSFDEPLADPPSLTLRGDDGTETAVTPRIEGLSYLYAAPSETFANTTYSLTGTATDLAGNVATLEATRLFSVDAIPPPAPTTVSIVEPAPYLGRIYAKAGSQLRVTLAGLDLSDLDAATMAVRVGEFPLTMAEGDPTTWVGTLTGTEAEGFQYVSGTFRDVAGNETSFSTRNEAEGAFVLFDFTPPSLVNNTVNPAAANLTSRIAVSFGFSEPVIGLSDSATATTLQVDWDGLDANAAFVATNPAATQSFSFTRPVTEKDDDTKATYAFAIARVSDLAGNVATDLPLGSVTIDSTPPRISNAALTTTNANPAWAKGNDVVTLSFDVTDEGGLSGDPTVRFNNAVMTRSGSGDTPYTFTYTVPAGANGARSPSVSISDLAGNITSETLAAEITLDTTAPTLVSTSVTPDVNATGIIGVAFGFSEPVENLSLDWAELDTVAPFTPGTQNTTQSFAYSRPVNAADADGLYSLAVASASDAAGNVASNLALGTVSIASSRPLITGLSLSHPRRSAVAGFELLDISFDVAKPLALPDGLAVSVGGNSAENCGTASTSAPFAYTCTYTVSETDTSGIKNVVVQTRDAAGNSDIQSSTVTFDFTPPTLVSPSISPTSANASSTITVAFGLSEDATVTPVTIGALDGFNPITTSAQNFAWTHPIDPADLDGTYTFAVDAADIVGNQALDLTIGELSVDATFPTINIESLTSNNANPAYAKAAEVVTLKFTADDAGGLQGAPTVRFNNTAMTRSGSGDTPYTFTYTVPAGTNGFQAPAITVTDAAGNTTTATPSQGVTLDTTAPNLVAPAGAPTANASVQLTPAPTNVLSSVTAVTTGTTVRVTLTANEDLKSIPTLTSTAPEAGLTFACSGSGRFFTCDHTFSDATPTQGSYTLRASLTDLANNQVNRTLTLTAPGFTVDTLAPTPPATDTPDAIIYRRIPWGADETGGTVAMKLRGAAGAAAGESTLISYTASTGGREIERTLTNPDGSFDEFDLLPSDRADIFVAAIDAAGNASPRKQVRDVEWVATMGGKVVGSTVENPHDFTGSPRFAATLVNPDTGNADAPLTGALSGLATVGAGTVTQVGNGLWDFAGESNTTGVSAQQFHAMAYDSARGKVVLFGEGSGGGETWEWDGTSWTQVATTGPSGRNDHAMAYDSKRGFVVMFGGAGPGGSLADTWEWNGTSWKQITTTGPSARANHAMAYDSARGKVVLFGGYGDDGYLSDTWEWDGASWNGASTNGPSARQGHAMAYDSARGKVVIFGGYFGSYSPLSDTWEWNGTLWTQVAVSGPRSRGMHAMAYDSARGEVVMFGGRDDLDGYLSDTWEWDGTSWRRRATTGPSARANHAMAYDSARGKLVMFGGYARGNLGDTWEWDGASWAEVAKAPSARAGHAMTYDSARGKVVMFGGYDGSFSVVASDTWEWNGKSWKQVSTTGPSARSGHAMAYDSAGGKVVLFGGDDGSARLADMWEWNGTSWKQVVTMGPSARESHAMAYDSLRARVVLFGGRNGIYALSDTWEWSGTSWKQVSTTGPSARSGHVMAYDSARGKVVLFGGDDGSARLADTWEWNGTSWKQVSTVGPSARSGHSMAYDSARVWTIVFGGYDGNYVSDTWVWDGASWSAIAPTGASPRSGHAIAYDSGRGKIAAFGGFNGFRFLNDTWESDGRVFASAGQQDRFDYGAAQASAATVLSVEARWFAGGVGYPSGVTTNGAELLAWDWFEARWKPVATNTSAPEAPTEMAWTTTDPLQLNRIFFGDNKTLNFAVRPTAPNGTGHPTDPDKPYGEIATDYVEVTVKYRLP